MTVLKCVILSSLTTFLNPTLHMCVNSWPHGLFLLGCLLGSDLLFLGKVFQSKEAHLGTIEPERMSTDMCMKEKKGNKREIHLLTQQLFAESSCVAGILIGSRFRDINKRDMITLFVEFTVLEGFEHTFGTIVILG